MSNRITSARSSFSKTDLLYLPAMYSTGPHRSTNTGERTGRAGLRASSGEQLGCSKPNIELSFLAAVIPVFSLAYGAEYTLGSPKCTGSGNVSCTVSVGFQPHWPGLRQDAVLAKDRLGNVIATTLLYGTGLGPQVALYPGIISTIAGIPGGWGYSGDRGPATAAVLSNPQGIATDNFGNIYIADSINQVVRQVSAKRADKHHCGKWSGGIYRGWRPGGESRSEHPGGSSSRWSRQPLHRRPGQQCHTQSKRRNPANYYRCWGRRRSFGTGRPWRRRPCHKRSPLGAQRCGGWMALAISTSLIPLTI